MKDKKIREKMFSHKIQFNSDNKWGIPFINKNSLRRFNIQLLGFDEIGAANQGNEDKTIHFFKEDYKFMDVYECPNKHIKRLARFEALLTPDFSMYTDFPLAMQIYATFMNRWCGAYWQHYGMTVIPSISWSKKESYDFSFAGIEKGSIVAVSTVGVRREEVLFMEGYKEMLKTIQPDYVYCYGKAFNDMDGNILNIDPYGVLGGEQHGRKRGNVRYKQ